MNIAVGCLNVAFSRGFFTIANCETVLKILKGGLDILPVALQWARNHQN